MKIEDYGFSLHRCPIAKASSHVLHSSRFRATWGQLLRNPSRSFHHLRLDVPAVAIGPVAPIAFLGHRSGSIRLSWPAQSHFKLAFFANASLRNYILLRVLYAETVRKSSETCDAVYEFVEFLIQARVRVIFHAFPFCNEAIAQQRHDDKYISISCIKSFFENLKRHFAFGPSMIMTLNGGDMIR